MAGLLLTACSSERAASRPTSLLLISVDTLRADHVHAYGYARATTPRIDALAAAGVRFTRAWAHSPWTLPSHASLLSGTHPFRHGVVDDGTLLGPSVPLLAPILRARGYRTSAVVSGFYVSSRFGFQRGFEAFEDFGLPQGLRRRDSVRAEEVTAQAARRIAEAGDKPFFLFAHYFDVHNDYDPPPPWNRAFDEDATVVPYVNYEHYRAHPLDPALIPHVVAQYDEEILYADAMIGRLLDALVAAGRRRDTLVVLIADHGEELFEHGSWGHGNSLYAEVLHVPLIFAGPGVPAGRAEDALVRHEDLAPTLLDLLALPGEAEMQGLSYAARVRAAGEGGPPGASARTLGRAGAPSGEAVRSTSAGAAGPVSSAAVSVSPARPAHALGPAEAPAGAVRAIPVRAAVTPLDSATAVARAQARPRLLLTETSRFDTNLVGLVLDRDAAHAPAPPGSSGGADEPGLEGLRRPALILDLASEHAELYDLATDSGERNDLSRAHPAALAALVRDLLGAVLGSVAERWVVSWGEGAAGCARVEGLLLAGDELSLAADHGSAPATGAQAGAIPFARLKRRAFGGAPREARFATVPPDAPVEFFLQNEGKVRAGGARCGWGGDGRRIAGAERLGTFQRIDPVQQGARLREPTPLGLTTGTGPSFGVRIESRRKANLPANLTPEERELLRSLGYAQ